MGEAPIYYMGVLAGYCTFEGGCECWNNKDSNPAFEDCVNCSAFMYKDKRIAPKKVS